MRWAGCMDGMQLPNGLIRTSFTVAGLSDMQSGWVEAMFLVFD